jgi:hypothetical protein
MGIEKEVKGILENLLSESVFLILISRLHDAKLST